MARPLDRILALEAVRVTEAAAMRAFKLAGRGDERAADQAAVEGMRWAFNLLPIDGTVVIGEGERDEVPMLFIGEKVGAGGLKVDIALDPLEGTTLTAKALPNALAVMAMAEAGTLLNAPDVYMDKIAVGPGYKEGVIDLDAEPADNILSIAKAKGVKPERIRALVLDRPRHEKIIAGIDVYMGQGGAPEGVLAAAALRCVGGQFQTRLVFRNDVERGRATKLGIRDFNKKYMLRDLASGDVVFAATGVTTGTMLEGVRFDKQYVTTHSIVMRSAT